MEEGNEILLRQVEILLANARQYNAETAIRVARDFWSSQQGRATANDYTNKRMTLNLDLSRSDDFLVAGFRNVINSRRKKRKIGITELRDASNQLSQARTKLKQLATARLMSTMPWKDAYVETLDATGRALYASRPELWKRAAAKRKKLLDLWEKQFTHFKSLD